MAALGSLSRSAIDRAAAEFDQLGRDAFLEKYGFGRATDYALVLNGREYDPKAIAGVAYGHDHPEAGPLGPADFNGGLALRSAYRGAGLDIVPRSTGGGTQLQQLLENILEAYADARQDPFSGSHPISDVFRALGVELGSSEPVRAREHVTVRVSAGQGNWARVPWVALLDGRITTTTQRGVYPVFLFREDMSGVYVTVAQGVTELRNQGRAHMVQALQATAASLRTDADDLEALGFQLDSAIDLRTQAGLGRDYEVSTVAHKLYERGAVPEDDTILRDVDAALDLVDRQIVRDDRAEPAARASLAEAVAAFREAVDASGLRVPTGHGDRVQAVMAALVTKPFVILSGLSGSGKTQLALRLGEWFGAGVTGRRSLTVAVRPDWTGPESLFGYEDALRPADAGRAAWAVPSTLSFMLRASREPDMPYLLILDEMNLAHVERYFSDFLSGIESRDQVLPNLEQGEDGEWRLVLGEPALLPLPRNVLVIGTINVDETTYQFSPKVLDRATTFEVRTATSELQDDLQRPTPTVPGADEHLRVITDLVRRDDWSEARLPQVTAVAASMRTLHAELTETGDEFGLRVFFEGLRLCSALSLLGITDRNSLLDHVLILKVLPRIHGSRRRAEPVLRRLRAFALSPDAPAPGDMQSGTTSALPMSSDKIERMLRTLDVNQFVSFTD